MKKLSLLFVIVIGILFSNTTFAQTAKKETINVWGSCGMCKKKIEKAAKSAGASSASWDAEKHELEVSYDESKSSNQKIQEAIVKVGYDTQDFTATQEAYDNLPGCCQYDRKPAKKDESKN